MKKNNLYKVAGKSLIQDLFLQIIQRRILEMRRQIIEINYLSTKEFTIINIAIINVY